MATVSQTIPNYYGGISEQPDELKIPGQVNSLKNVLPDITNGLLKRPGGKLVGGSMGSYTTNSKWFHYYRDENEQYIGQLQLSSGEIKMWRCDTGAAVDVNYDGDSSMQTALKNYLKTTGTHGILDSDVQTLTLNDFTYFTNRNKIPAMKTADADLAPKRPPEAYIELKKVAYASQYSINLFDNLDTTDVYTAIRIDIKRDRDSAAGCDSNGDQPPSGTLPGDPNYTSRCDESAGKHSDGLAPNTDTQIFKVNHGAAQESINCNGNTDQTFDVTHNGGDVVDRKNLYFRITTQGQSVAVNGSTGDVYRARYTTTFDLLYGGEGWRAGDFFYVWMKNARYKVTIMEHNISKVQGNLGIFRPTPTSFDTKTTVTSEGIMGGVRHEIETKGTFKDSAGATVEQVGNGLYLKRDSVLDGDGNETKTFNLTTGAGTLFNVFSNTIKDITDLPSQCKNGYIVKVANSVADEDDYFVQFNGVNGRDGPGTWEECAEPGRQIAFDPATMPIQMIRESTGTFTIKQCIWEDCLVGDSVTVSKPSFIGKGINKMLFFRNRMVMLSDENVIMSRPGDFFNYWPKTAVTYTASDNVDISCSSEYPAIVYDGIQVNTGLLLFTKNQQFMLTTDSDVLSPNTAKINALATYNFNYKTNPISMGTTVAFLDNAGQYARFFEITAVLREGQPEVLEQSKPVSKSFPKDINIIANSRENSVIFFGKTDEKKLYAYRYFSGAERRIQQAWFTWELSGAIQHMAMLDDSLYVVIRNRDGDSLQKFAIKIDEDSATLEDSNEDTYRIHLDNYKSIPYGSLTYNSTSDYTHFTLPQGFNQSHLECTYTKLGRTLTVTSTVNHEFAVGQKVNLKFLNGDLVNGDYTVLTVPTTTSFTVLSREQDGIDNITTTSNVIVNALSGAILVATGTDKNMQGLYATTTTYEDDGEFKVKVPGNFKSYQIAPDIHADDGVVASRTGTVLTLDFTAWLAADNSRIKHPFKVGDVITCDFASDITDGNITVTSVPDNETLVTSTATGSTVSNIKVAISSEQTPEHNLIFGYLFDMEVDFPRLYKYERGMQEGSFRTDVHSSLIIHRLKFSLGPSGVYDFEVIKTGKDTFTKRLEIINPDDYLANTITLSTDKKVTIPIYEKNINLDLKLKSTHPSPATLYSLTWEGDHTDGYYKRV